MTEREKRPIDCMNSSMYGRVVSFVGYLLLLLSILLHPPLWLQLLIMANLMVFPGYKMSVWFEGSLIMRILIGIALDITLIAFLGTMYTLLSIPFTKVSVGLVFLSVTLISDLPLIFRKAIDKKEKRVDEGSSQKIRRNIPERTWREVFDLYAKKRSCLEKGRKRAEFASDRFTGKGTGPTLDIGCGVGVRLRAGR